MPSNLDPNIVKSTREPRETLVQKLLPTFKGWILRQGAKVAAVATASTSAWLAGQQQGAISWAQAHGASPETIQKLTDAWVSFDHTAGLAITAVVFFVTEMALSRVAAKYPEKKK